MPKRLPQTAPAAPAAHPAPARWPTAESLPAAPPASTSVTVPATASVHLTAPATAPAAAPASPALLPLWTAGLYREASAELRARLIECLMRPMGALGLVAVAGGVFAAVRQRHGWQQLQVTPDDTASVSADHVYQLAGYLQEAAPQAFDLLGRWLGSQPAALATVSGVLLWQALRQRPRLERRRSR